MIKAIFTFCVLLFYFTLSAFAQEAYVISGVVKDNKEVLPGAAVYVSGYKIATVTNGDGKFTLPKLAPGNYDLLVQMIGYVPLKKNVAIIDKSVVVELKLTESTTILNEVVIKPDPDRAYYLMLFKDFFIGKTPNAAQCKILNSQVIEFDYDKRERILTAKASDFLVIENKVLGYRIKYLLEQFDYNFTERMLFYAGYPTFEEMKGGNAKQKRWSRNREIAYKGSSQHFFNSLYHHKISEEGFVMYKRYEIPNGDRLPDSLIETNIKQLMNNKGATLTINNQGGTGLNYWLKERRKPKTLFAIDRSGISVDTLVKTFNPNIKSINYKDDLFIIYKNEKESLAYENTPFYLNRPLDLKGFQVSIIKMLSAPIYFYANGLVYNPRSTLYSGFWSYEKMADTVPMDYVLPDKTKKN
ncbi:carboxypeptidase-like regulatory domain-containing protein [Pedobacter sp. Du54]|uniref:carboxypeptidase-like regulatory domain-containing protein n=1 Tax=Pedobacter anseongensis TaxID=3133439 RepID=UPI0030A22B7C